MTLPKFTSRAMDLSGIAAAAKAPPVPPGASFVIEVDESNFESVMQLSTRHPIVVELYSPRANAQALSDDLAGQCEKDERGPVLRHDRFAKRERRAEEDRQANGRGDR